MGNPNPKQDSLEVHLVRERVGVRVRARVREP